jgi:hypothetical protein
LEQSPEFWQETKFGWFVVFGWIVVPGITMFVVALMGPVDWPYALVGMAGFLLTAPFIVHMNLLAIWHWKARYVGNHSKLWGFLIVLLTFTSWGNLIYLFRHILPDRRHSGRYKGLTSKPAID